MSGESSAALILCAGYSSRMGDFKPLLPIGGVSALSRVVRTLRLAGVSRIFAVTGHNRAALSDTLRLCDAEEIYNPDFDKGMFSSVLAGVSRLARSEARTDGAFIWPCDCPLCPEETVAALLREGLRSERLALPVFNGISGHPLWTPSRLFGEILAHDGEDGLRGVTRRYDGETLKLEARDTGAVADMDTRADYERLCAIYAARKKRRVFLARCDDADESSETLSAPRISRTARELRRLGASPERLYCGERELRYAELLSRELGLPAPRPMTELGASVNDSTRKQRERAARRLGVLLSETGGDVLALARAEIVSALDSALAGVWPPRELTEPDAVLSYEL